MGVQEQQASYRKRLTNQWAFGAKGLYRDKSDISSHNSHDIVLMVNSAITNGFYFVFSQIPVNVSTLGHNSLLVLHPVCQKNAEILFYSEIAS